MLTDACVINMTIILDIVDSFVVFQHDILQNGCVLIIAYTGSCLVGTLKRCYPQSLATERCFPEYAYY
jgi:hypothetical protein